MGGVTLLQCVCAADLYGGKPRELKTDVSQNDACEDGQASAERIWRTI